VTTAQVAESEHQSGLRPVMGASSLAQLDEALGALELELTDDELAVLDAA
jgi:aryl-alcohol dehydrogenase-like predicted oxidoreductase